MDYDVIMKIIKDVAIIIGILVAATTLVVHWKAIIRPDLYRIEERRFKAVEDVYSFLSDYRFFSLYAGNRDFPIKEFLSVLKDKMSNNSPFLPEHIERRLIIFIFNAGWYHSCLMEKEFNDEKDGANAMKRAKERILNAHKEVFLETIKFLDCPDKEFPFPENVLSLMLGKASVEKTDKT